MTHDYGRLETAGAIATRLGTALAAAPLVYALDEGAVRRYERTVFVG